jgi:fatty-acyl-CoA synthase
VSRYLELCTLGDLLVRGSEHHPGRDALVLPGVRRTYRELEERATGVARSLTAMGVTRGDRVGLFMPNGPEFIESLFGILFTGAVAVPVNARFTAPELSHVTRDADLRVLLASDAPGEPRTRADVIAEALGPDPASTGLAAVVALGPALRPSGGMMSQEAFGQLAEQVPADVVEARRRRVALRDPAIMFYTSGTTAMPKGCVLSHEAQVRTGVATRIRLGYADGERVFAPCPMFHTASTQPMVATMHAFGTFVSMGHFDPAPALELIEAEQVTAMFPAFPPLTLGMLNSPGYSPASFARVRTVFTVAPPEALRAMQRRMPHSVLVNAYGMTEFGGSVVMVDPADGDDARLATQGPPFPGLEIGIRDEANRRCPPENAARSSSAGRACSTATTTTQPERGRPRPSTRAAGTTAVTSALSVRTAGSATWAGSRTCSRWAGRTWRPWRSPRTCRRIPASVSRRWSAWPTRSTARCPQPSSSCTRARR